jgi:hypothetical protein
VKQFVQTCWAAPSQWEGQLKDGRALYIRVRHGHLRVRISDGPTTDISHAVRGPTLLHEQLDELHESFMDTATMVQAVSGVLDFSRAPVPEAWTPES